MALLLKVKWVEQADTNDPCQRIVHIGGQNGQFQWRHTHADAAIEKLLFHYYMEKDTRVLKVKVGLAPNGDKYLKTEVDNGSPEVLLTLPGFPVSAPV